jgi:DNA-binding NarL/FixJ family response regulator
MTEGDMPDDIRVLVVDPDPAFARAFKRALPPRSGVRVFEVPGPTEAGAAFDAGTAHIAVVDLACAEGERLHLVRHLRRASERARVLVHVEEQTPEIVADALRAGACGFFSIRGEDGLVASLRRAKAGELVLPSVHLAGIVRRLDRRGHPLDEQARLDSLTAREAQILRALADGRGTDEIAAMLGISRMTVQSHVKSILAKLGLHSKVEAVTLAWRFGLASGTRIA